jgi:hypothetical protein
MADPITKLTVSGALVASLSGPIDDYTWKYDNPTSTVSVTAKLSYQDRFKTKKTEIAELRDRVTELEDALAKSTEADAYVNHVVMRTQVYTNMGRGTIYSPLLRTLATNCE